MNTRERVLKEALNCVNREREKQYGNPEDNFRRIADLWSTYLTSLFEDEKIVVDIDPIDVAKMMILFKIARSNGDKDKLDNYVDMIGYGACAAEIFENKNPMEKVFIDEWVGKMKDFGGNDDGKEACETINELKEKMYADVFLGGNSIEVAVADECKDCDYAEKCMGTGVCLKEKEKECIKDKPDEKCNRKDCGQFDACMTAYQYYIYNKTKEASEAIDKCLLDNMDPYSYAHNKLANYVSIKANEEQVPLDNLKSIDRKFPRELEEFLDQAATDCIANGKQFLDCYKEIDELFKKYTNKNKSINEQKDKDKKYSTSLLNIYSTISADVFSFSTSANVDPFDIIGRLTINGHAPTVMAELVLVGKLNYDCVVHYIEDAIHEAKEKSSICQVNEIMSEISHIMETAKHLKGFKYDHMNLYDDELIVVLKKTEGE